MDNQIKFLLGSMRAQDRKKAIHMLTQVADQEALRLLAGVYKNDPDAEIRELAVKAGKYIKREQTRAQEASVAAPKAIAEVEEVIEEPEEEPEEEITPVDVSAVNQERAKGMLDRALDLSIRGEQDKAIDSLIKAFKANPNYRLDSYAMGIAMDVARADHAQTLRILSGNRDALKARQSATKLKNESITDEASWDTVGTKLAWYYLGMAALIFVASALLIYINKAGFASVRTLLAQGCSSCSSEETLRLGELLRSASSVESMSLLHSFLHAVVGAAILIALLMLYHGILYVVSSILFRKSATYRGLMYRTMPSIVITYGVGAVLLATAVILLSTDTFNPHYKTLAQQKATFSSSPITQGLVFLALLIPFGGNLWLADSIAQYYKGTWNQGRWAAYIAFFFFWFMTIGVGLAIYMTNLRATTPGL